MKILSERQLVMDIKKIFEKKEKSTLNKKLEKNVKVVQFLAAGFVFACLAVALITILCNYIGNRNFRETFYTVSSIKADNPIRVIQISDLHSVSYGKGNKKLTDRTKALEPDIILLTGDIADSAKKDYSDIVVLCSELADIAPTYYVYGNNEVEKVYGFPLVEAVLDEKFGFSKDFRDEKRLVLLKDQLEIDIENVGVKVLKNEKDTVKVGDTTVDVYGVLNSNPSSFWSYSEKSFLSYTGEDEDNLKLTTVHEPFIFEEFNHDFWGDILVCGHTHGGVIRVPVLGPLYTQEGGLFPERDGCYVYGRYDVSGKPLIVSSGLENKNLLRINNQPELVVIDINKF